MCVCVCMYVCMYVCTYIHTQVKDRAVIHTTDEERKCLTPPGLQAEIDILVSQFPKGRSFVR